MFKSSKQPQSIDFLQPVYSPTDMWATAYIWLANIGKYLLMGVEVLVLGVFFSRFILDKQNNDLTEDLNAKVAVLSNDSWKKNAALYENYQVLLNDVKLVSSKQEINSVEISELMSGIPASLHLVNFSYTGQKVSLRMTSNNLETVKNYEAALKNNSHYSDVRFTISKENNDLSVNVNFSLVNE